MEMRARKRQKIVGTDDGSDSDERDKDWIPEENEADQIHSPVRDNDKSLPDDTEFDSTEGFKLIAAKSIKQSNHLIWTMFGQLMKNNKIVDRNKDRIYCIRCFENKKFKA